MSEGYVKKLLPWALAAASVASPVWGQRKQISINAETPHGAVLQKIGQEGDAAKKLAHMEEFASKFGTDAKLHDELLWVYSQKQDLHVKAQEWDKAIEAGTKAVAIDPEYLEVAVAALKAAEAKKEMAQVKSWAGKTSEIARRSVATPKRGEEEADDAKARIDYAKQVATYADYALFNAAIQGGSPAVTIEMAEALKAQSPDGEYWPQVAPGYVLALNQQGQAAKAVGVAEELLGKDATNDDLLLLVGNHYFGLQPASKANQDKVLLYTDKAVAAWGTRQKPAAMAEVDWEKKKAGSLGYSLWMNGMTQAALNKLPESDKVLRQALPMLTNDQLKAGALFNLGLANFKMGEAAKNKAQLTDAANFSRLCAAIKSPYQAQAAANLKGIQAKLAGAK